MAVALETLYSEIDPSFHVKLLTKSCYGKMIDEIGYKRESGCNRTVKEIAEEHNMKTLILRIEGHLTCCINGLCYDLWDCTDEPVDVYWIVE